MQRKLACAVFASVSLVILTSCAPPAMRPPHTGTRPFSQAADNGTSPSPVVLTPLTYYADQWSASDAEGPAFANMYTRVVVSSVLPQLGGVVSVSAGDDPKATAPEILAYQQRHPLKRLILGRDVSVNLTAKIAVGRFESTIPLATVGHVSNRDGEHWTRVIHHTVGRMPLFLVAADGNAAVPSVSIALNGTRSYTSSGAALALQAALGVAKATGARPSVITRLSEQSIKDQARALDDAISKLFATGVTEEHWTDRDLRYWRADEDGAPLGVDVTMHLPDDPTDWNSRRRPVGTWTVTFDAPRPSIFSDWRVCAKESIPKCKSSRDAAEVAAMNDVSEAEVLSYILNGGASPEVSIRDHMLKQEWYGEAVKTFASQDGDITSAATAFCRRIASEITSLGLNNFDAGIVVWAVIRGMPLPVDEDRFSAAPTCREALAFINDARAGASER